MLAADVLAQSHILQGASLWAFALLLSVVPKDRRLLPATRDLGLLAGFGVLLGAANFADPWRILTATTAQAFAVAALTILVGALLLRFEYGRRGIVARFGNGVRGRLWFDPRMTLRRRRRWSQR